MEGFRNVKEFFRALHHVPANVEIEFFRERHEAVKNFRDAASHRSGVDHLDAAAAQRLGQSAQFLDFARTDHVRVIFQGNAVRRQDFGHTFLLSRSIRRSILARALSSVFV